MGKIETNLYSYALIDPLNMTDPDGFEAVAATLPGQMATVSLDQILNGVSFIGSAALFAQIVKSKMECAEDYRDDKEFCIRTFNWNQNLLSSCLEWARKNYRRCLWGYPRKPFHGYNQ